MEEDRKIRCHRRAEHGLLIETKDGRTGLSGLSVYHASERIMAIRLPFKNLSSQPELRNDQPCLQFLTLKSADAL